jgi:O-acetyl-ADP-ribose deacetylase (regulator of RNase III)
MQKFILVDNKRPLADAWTEEFSKYPNFEIHGGVDIFDYPGDAVVSPANSFGFMDGGIDLLYSMNMGWHVQGNLQWLINQEFNGELLIGQAAVLPTGYTKFPNIICSPTMRVPMDINGMPNVYLCAKAMFIAAKNHPEFKTIVCPGLGTGTGRISPKECAMKMRMAYEDFYLGNWKFPKNLLEASMKNAEETTKF